MILKHYLADDLRKLRLLVAALNDIQFTKSLTVLSGSTLGQHLRHILEFYLTLVNTESDVLSYDNRKRDREIETSRERCVAVIDRILNKLDCIDAAKTLTVESNYGFGEDTILMSSTSGREAGYVLEHSVHHQALIKIGLTELGLTAIADFGVAPATIRARVKVS